MNRLKSQKRKCYDGKLLISSALSLFFALCAHGQNPADFEVLKVANYTQESSSTPNAEVGLYPYQFFAVADLPGSIAVPATGYTYPLEDDGDGTYSIGWGFNSKQTMDSTFQPGMYQFLVTWNGAPESVSVNLSPDDYPTIPQILNGNWALGTGQWLIEPTPSGTTLKLSSFKDYASEAFGYVEFTFVGPPGFSDYPPVDDVWQSTQQSQPPSSVTVETSNIQPGVQYSCTISYLTYTSKTSTTYGTTVAGYSSITNLTAELDPSITPTPTPTPTPSPTPTPTQPPFGTDSPFQPAGALVASGSPIALDYVLQNPAAGVTYQWFLNSSPVAGQVSPLLYIPNATSNDAGTWTCSAYSSETGTSLQSAPCTVTVDSTSLPGRLVNLSSRAVTVTGPNQLIAGFVVGGSASPTGLPVLVRASGPALEVFGVPGVLPDPSLFLDESVGGINTQIGSNTGWAGNPAVATAAIKVGAFVWTDPLSLDSALTSTLSTGAYTASVVGASGDSGDTLAEVYDASGIAPQENTASRLINISARVEVGTGGNVLIVGFVISGDDAATVLIRASGPALAPFGISTFLPDPVLTLYQSDPGGNNTVIDANSGWGANSSIAAAANAAGAFSWGSSPTPDSAIAITLPPGAYTAQVSGASGDTGVALVEVYDLDP